MKGWINLDSIGQFDEIVDQSSSQTAVIFKHSTRCSISSMAQRRLHDLDVDKLQASFYYLDLIAHRDVSNYIAEKLSEHRHAALVLGPFLPTIRQRVEVHCYRGNSPMDSCSAALGRTKDARRLVPSALQNVY